MRNSRARSRPAGEREAAAHDDGGVVGEAGGFGAALDAVVHGLEIIDVSGDGQGIEAEEVGFVAELEEADLADAGSAVLAADFFEDGGALGEFAGVPGGIGVARGVDHDGGRNNGPGRG